MSDAHSFNVIDEPWIPVLWNNGRYDEAQPRRSLPCVRRRRQGFSQSKVHAVGRCVPLWAWLILPQFGFILIVFDFHRFASKSLFEFVHDDHRVP